MLQVVCFITLLTETQTEAVPAGSINDEPLQMTGFPSFQLALKFHIPVAGKTNLWVSAGGSVSKWNNINDNYQVF